MSDLKKIYELYIESKQNVCIDTRSKKIKNSIFFALKGTKYNGNSFAQEALKKGAKYIVVDEPFKTNNKRIIKVKNTLKTLQKLAIIHRSNWGENKFVIGITGTNGKTTTKEILNQILSSSLNINSTKGNLNNHIGVPLTILALNNNHTGCIVELGANHQGEIKELCRIANPTHGIITNIGEAHLEGFKDVDTIIKTKNELYNYIKKNGGTIFVNKLDSTSTLLLCSPILAAVSPPSLDPSSEGGKKDFNNKGPILNGLYNWKILGIDVTRPSLSAKKGRIFPKIV